VDARRFASHLSFRTRRRQPSHVAASDSSAPAESLLTSQSDDLFPGSWSADGRSLVFVDSPRTATQSSRPAIDGRQVTAVPAFLRSNRPAISPDGRWLAYGTPPSEASGGRRSTSVRFQARDRHVNSSMPPASPCGAGTARRSFSQQTRRAAGSSGDGIFEMPFDRSRGIAAGPERNCSGKPLPKTRGWAFAGYDVAPDGRFLLVIPDESESIRPDMNVLLNVDDELRRRVR
jgi:hypothetical protein